jgi:hypothetical protein
MEYQIISANYTINEIIFLDLTVIIYKYVYISRITHLSFFFKKNLKLVDEVQKIVLYYSLKHAFK